MLPTCIPAAAYIYQQRSCMPRWVNGNPRRCLFVLHGVHTNGVTCRKRSLWGFGVQPIVHQAIARSSYFICCSAIFIFVANTCHCPASPERRNRTPAYLYAPGVEVQSEYQPDSPWQPLYCFMRAAFNHTRAHM